MRRLCVGLGRLNSTRPRHGVHDGAEDRLRVEHRIGKPAGNMARDLFGHGHQSSPRTMVKKSTFVAAVSARRFVSASA